MFQLQSRNQFQSVMILHKTGIIALTGSAGQIWGVLGEGGAGWFFFV